MGSKCEVSDAIGGYFAMEDPASIGSVSIDAPYLAHLGGKNGGLIYGVVPRMDERPLGTVIVGYQSGWAPTPRHAGRHFDELRIYVALGRQYMGWLRDGSSSAISRRAV